MRFCLEMASSVSGMFGMACRKCFPVSAEGDQHRAGEGGWVDTYMGVLVCGGEGRLKARVEQVEEWARISHLKTDGSCVVRRGCPKCGEQPPPLSSPAPGFIVMCENPFCRSIGLMSYTMYAHNMLEDCGGERLLQKKKGDDEDDIARGGGAVEQGAMLEGRPVGNPVKVSEYYTRMCLGAEKMLMTPLPSPSDPMSICCSSRHVAGNLRPAREVTNRGGTDG